MLIIQKDGTNVIGVIHRKGHAFTLEIVHVQRGRCAAVLWRIHELQLQVARARRDKVRRTVLVAERVTADHDGLDPSGYGPRDALEDDRLAEDGATEDVANLCAGKGSRRKGHVSERCRGKDGEGGKGKGMRGEERERPDGRMGDGRL